MLEEELVKLVNEEILLLSILLQDTFEIQNKKTG
jgi:hypothetical protein